MPSNDVKQKKSSSKKSRYHAFMTYATIDQINRVIYDHQTSIVSYAYICHDGDQTERHYHLIIRTYDAWSPSQILKWFAFVKLETDQNTFVEELGDLKAFALYLTHKDAKSVEAGKHPYDKSLIKDFGLLSNDTTHESYDDTYEIVLAMMAGMRTRDLVRRYGKKFIYHYSQFVAVKDAIDDDDRMERAIAADFRSKQEALQKQPPIPLDNIDIDDVLK